MGKRTRTITLSALFSAIAVLILYFASIWPTGQLGLVAAASLLTAAAVIETGLLSGAYVYIVSSVLGMLLVPNRVAALLFVLFFGFYPILKSLIERRGGLVIQWVLKLLVFNVSLTVLWLFFRAFFFSVFVSNSSFLLIYIVGNFVFVLFDYGFTKLVWFYIERVSRLRKKDG